MTSFVDLECSDMDFSMGRKLSDLDYSMGRAIDAGDDDDDETEDYDQQDFLPEGANAAAMSAKKGRKFLPERFERAIKCAIEDDNNPEGSIPKASRSATKFLKKNSDSSRTLSETDDEEPIQKIDHHNNKKDKEGINANEFDPQSYRNDDFFADSPYFDAFVNKEINAAATITETLNDIADKTDNFAESGLDFAIKTRRLASSCRVRDSTAEEGISRRKALEPEVADGLERLGDVLDEKASAQEHLCRYFKSFLVAKMRSIAENDDTKRSRRMSYEAQKETKEAEQLFMKYFHGIQDSLRKPEGYSGGAYSRLGSIGVGQASCSGGRQPRRGSLGVVQPSCGGARQPRRGSIAVAQSRSTGDARQRKRGSLQVMKDFSMDLLQQKRRPVNEEEEMDNDPVAKATEVARWKHNLVQIRTLHTKAELKRYRLATYIVHSKCQQNVEISNCANQLVGEISSYFSHCSNLASGLICGAKNMKAKCEELQLKLQGRNWVERERLLDDNLTLLRQAEANARMQKQKILNTPPCILEQSSQEYDLKEEKDQIWDIPATLAHYTSHRRPRVKDVLVEGWLYKKIGLSQSGNASQWSRSWFLVRKDGIFNLQSNVGSIDNKQLDDKQDSTDFIIKKVKVCDLQLCTIRDVAEDNQDPSTRFCFELITPNNYSERPVFQARGPYEYKMWLEAIRLGISNQLAAGEDVPLARRRRRRNSLVDCLSINNILNVPCEPERTSSEVRVAVLERGRSLFVESTGSMSKYDNASETPDDIAPEMKELMKANPTCADCGEGHPDWVSLNLGVLICLECSGVHRSLGVHVSKVRSLTLDALNARESSLLFSLGNARVNKIWENEQTIDSEQRKADRENWIWRKYVQKEFIGNCADCSSKENACQELYNASKRGDVVGVAKAIAHGGDVNWKNPLEDNKTALGVCGVDLHDRQQDGKAFECEELLIQNGATTTAAVSPKKFNLFNMTSCLEEEM